MYRYAFSFIGIAFLALTSSLQIPIACSNCLYGEESCTNGSRCLFGCVPGWLEPTCVNKCSISHCSECMLVDGQEQCSKCQPGVYGLECTHICSDLNCMRFQYKNNTCDTFGNCLFGCEFPYVGDMCEEQSCPFNNCDHCKVGPSKNLYCASCHSGFYWNSLQEQCQPCSSQCLNGPTDCDPLHGTCPKCKRGWFGTMCNYRCQISNCLECVSQGSEIGCIRCEDSYAPSGYKNGQCVSCKYNHCIGGQCDSSTGACPLGCQPGWFGRDLFCNISCDIGNCKQCGLNFFSEKECVECNDGYYTKYEGCLQCPANCNGSSCQGTTGFCENGCIEGYYGKKCEYRCSPHCLTNNCSSDTGDCECETEWFGDKCDRQCPPYCTDCPNYVPGRCASCEPGRYGPLCEHKCSENCQRNTYSNYIYCDQDTGKCDLGCNSGFYGDLCITPCSEHCTGSCSRDDGICLVGCTHYHWGSKCEQPCPENCGFITVGYQRTCNIRTGSCNHGCQAGFYGDYCRKPCVKNCKDNICDQAGDCVHGCSEGYSGRDCDISCWTDCPNDCSPNCYQGLCDDLTKSCSSGCEQGWWGAVCGNICNARCTERHCHQITGVCLGTCLVGSYGPSCEETCSRQCVNNICDKLTGKCKEGCQDNLYFGDQCNMACPGSCNNSTCNRDTGKCLSCYSGKHGGRCDLDCLPGTYGENCVKQCGHCKDSNPCNILDGRCPAMSGCEVGWTGSMCTQSIPGYYQGNRVTERPPTIEIAIGSGVSFLLVIIILAVGVYCWRKHRTHNGKQKTMEPVVVYSDASVTIQTPGAAGMTTNMSATIDSDSAHSSDTLLLGSDTSAMQVNIQSVIRQTDHYKLHDGHMVVGNKQQACVIRISEIDASSDESKEIWNQLMNETEIHRLSCSHINILQLLTTYQNKNMYCVAFEHCAVNNLQDYLCNLASQQLQQSGTGLDKRPRPWDFDDPAASSGQARAYPGAGTVTYSSDQEQPTVGEEEPIQVCKLLQFCVDIASAIDHLQKLKVLHRQICAKHVYLSELSDVKLGDFFWAEVMNEDSIMAELPEDGYHHWAPETLLHKRFMLQTDIWGLGMLFWEILSLGKKPYADLDSRQHKQTVLNGMRPSKPDLAHHNMYRLMKNCWRYSIEDRPSADHVIQQLLDIQNWYSDVQNMCVQV